MGTWHGYFKEQGHAPDWPYPIRFDQEQEIDADVLVIGGGIRLLGGHQRCQTGIKCGYGGKG